MTSPVQQTATGADNRFRHPEDSLQKQMEAMQHQKLIGALGGVVRNDSTGSISKNVMMDASLGPTVYMSASTVKP